MALEAYTQDQFIEMLKRSMGEQWLEGLRKSQSGFEIVQAATKVGERMSQAVANFYQALYARTAPLGAKATMNVSITRTTTADAVTVLAGTKVLTIGGPFVLTEDVAFGVGDDGPHTGTFQAQIARYETNFDAGFTAASGAAVPAPELEVVLLKTDPPFGDVTLQFVQSSAATGGVTPALELHAEERAQVQKPGESLEQLRLRLSLYRRSATPTAIDEFLHSVLDPLGQEFHVIEVFADGYRGCYDAPDPNGTADDVAGMIIWDDPRTGASAPSTLPWWGRWADSREVQASFIVLVPNLPAMSEMGFCCDDPADVVTDLNSPIGERALGACDWIGPISADLKCGALDAGDKSKSGTYLVIWSGLQELKAFGMSAALELNA